jgi:hypothetical protein
VPRAKYKNIVPVVYNEQKIIASAGLREVRWEGAIPFLQCHGETHKRPVWLAAQQFPINIARGGYYLRPKCRRCHNHEIQEARSKKNPNSKGLVQHGLIPLSAVQVQMHELVKRCGGYHPAARALNATCVQTLRWCGRTAKAPKYIQRTSAARIFSTLDKVRKGEIVERPKKRGTKPKPVINEMRDNRIAAGLQDLNE